MKLLFDHRMFEHINQVSIHESGSVSRSMLILEAMLRRRLVAVPLCMLEYFLSFVLNLPIPIYSSLVYRMVTHARGLPYFAGNYLRALYYRPRLGGMESNVFIDQGVFFAFPKGINLSEFSFIDKNVVIMSKTATIGRRVHIASNVFVSGGGNFEIHDYACVATKSSIITSTETLKDGARCSGPMVTPAQRNVLRGNVVIEKDAFVGASVTILPNVTVKRGSVVGAGVTLSRDTEAWGIYALPRAEKISVREQVAHSDN